MNTKQTSILGWVAYTAAFVIGGAIGIHRYWYAPGGRMDREKEANRLRHIEAVKEAVEEQRIREERNRLKRASSSRQ